MLAASRISPRQRYAMFAIAFLVLAVVGNWFWSLRQERVDLLGLPTQERQALYKRTLETLESVCVSAAGSEIKDYCRKQAQFIARFPECDAACEAACRSLAPRPTK
jgi:hypothetical protein